MSLEEVQAGDYLRVNDRLGIGFSLSKVIRVTKTQVICGNARYRKNGSVVGGDTWSRVYARPSSKEDFKEMAILKARQLIKDNADSLSGELALEIASMIKAGIK